MLKEHIKGLKIIPHIITHELDTELIMLLEYCLTDEVPLATFLSDGVDAFYKDVPRHIKKIINKKDRQKVIDSLLNTFYDEKLDGDILISLYTRDEKYKKPDNSLPELIKELHGFMYKTRYDRLQYLCEANTADDHDFIEKDFTKFLKAASIPRKHALNMMGLVKFAGVIEEIKKNPERYLKFISKLGNLPSDVGIPKTDQLLLIQKIVVDEFFGQYRQMTEIQASAKAHQLKHAEVEKQLLSKKLDKETEKTEKYKALINKLNSEKADMQKELKAAQLKTNAEKRYKKTITEKDELITKLKKEIVELKQQCARLATAQTPPETHKEVYKLKEEIKSLSHTLNNKQAELNLFKIKAEKPFKSRLEEYFKTNSMDEDIFRIIKPKYEEYLELKKKAESRPANNRNTADQRRWKLLGYCIIKNNKHYVQFPNQNDLHEILNLPENLYLAQHQFVLVDNRYNFLYSFNYYYEPHEVDYLISRFAKAEYINGELMVDVFNNEHVKLYHDLKNAQLFDGQIVSISSNNTLVRYYKPLKFNAETIMDSVLAKGFKLYSVEKVFDNAVHVKDVLTKNELLITEIDFNGFPVEEKDVISLSNNRVINCFKSRAFYRTTKYYDGVSFGTVELKNGIAYVRKLNDELVILNNIPTNYTLNDGNVVAIDEENNFIQLKENKGILPDTQEKRKKSEPKTQKPDYENSEGIEITNHALIIGNPSYKSSYAIAFRKQGYDVEVVDGFESYPKIASAMKDKDVVIVITTFVSHDVMYRVKKECQDIPVIFTGNDGANQLVIEIQKLDGIAG